jgi:hypothetical protein
MVSRLESGEFRLCYADAVAQMRWFDQELSIGTIKNRMAVIRWWSQKVNKQNVVARSNEHYGIPDRRFISNESKAKSVTGTVGEGQG